MRKLHYFMIVTIISGVFCLSWSNPAKDKLKIKVDAFLNSAIETPEPSLVNELREGKETSLKWLRDTYWKEGLNYHTYKSNKKFLKLYDKVSGQKDAIAANLFWYNSIDEALAEAKKTNKPVIALQMLGDLSDDFSCANSRFFRTLLYSNSKISQLMRDEFILCHESVIKVPKVIIEYPDGKKQIQTITGNSMHLVLNSDGKILDALPGLYGPEFFRKWLQQFSDPLMMVDLKSIQKQRIETLMNPSLNEMLAKEDWNDLVNEKEKSPMAAIRASEISAAKIAVERPVYTGIYGADKTQIKKTANVNPKTFPGYAAFGFVWEEITEETIKLLEAKKEYTLDEMKLTFYKISDNLSKESVRNDVKLHRIILELLQENPDISKKQFVERVYSDLFLTPLNDPKMGLYDKSIYSGLTDDGFIEK